MRATAKKEKEMLEHLESIVDRYVLTKDNPNLEACRKGEVRIIEILGKHGPLTMTDVAERAGLSVSTITFVMDNLVEKKLVKRERSEKDRRVVWVELMPDGRQIFDQVTEVHLSMVRGMLNSLNKEEQDMLISLFRKVALRIEREKSVLV